MWSNRRRSEATRRALERRKREDGSPRLKEAIPKLLTLELEIHEWHLGAAAEVGHIRRVMVENAPALFEVPCADKSCKEGGHDLTPLVMVGLERLSPKFHGEHTCRGNLGAAQCGRVLRFVAFATYRS
jgi:hypothetical protein